MVWIHGGAYQTGCTAEKEFDGSALARRQGLDMGYLGKAIERMHADAEQDNK